MSTGAPDGRPARVRITSPRTTAARTRAVAPSSEIDSQSALGEIYLSSLLRAQLRLAAGVLAVVLSVLGSLPVVFRLFPGLTRVEVLGMPLPWVLLAFAVYPFLLACGWAYVRRAERHERAFEAMLGQPRDPSAAPERP